MNAGSAMLLTAVVAWSAAHHEYCSFQPLNGFFLWQCCHYQQDVNWLILLTRAGQAVLAGKALYGGQLALDAAHHLPYPVEGMLHPLQGPQQPEQAEVA